MIWRLRSYSPLVKTLPRPDCGWMMRYATVEHSDDGHYGLDVLPVGGGDEPICARRPSPIRERHREDGLPALLPLPNVDRYRVVVTDDGPEPPHEDSIGWGGPT